MNRFFPNYNTYKITSRYGMRTLSGKTRMHNGIDLVAKTNSGGSATDYITAHSGGKVSAVGYNSSCGYYVQILVGNATMVYYHLREMSSLKAGQTVKTGEKIGYMGSTGNSTGAHLHFGIKVNGKWIDPEPYLDKDYEEEQTVNISLNVLKKGSKGSQVKALQRMLYSLGYDLGKSKVDGDFGTKTDLAVKAYQKKNNLTSDGIVGQATWEKLLKG